MTDNSNSLRPHEITALQELRRLQSPAYRYKKGFVQDPEAYRRELSRLKRMIFAREADADPHHELNSAMRTFGPQLTGHKGKCKMNRERSKGRITSYK